MMLTGSLRWQVLTDSRNGAQRDSTFPWCLTLSWASHGALSSHTTLATCHTEECDAEVIGAGQSWLWIPNPPLISCLVTLTLSVPVH